MSNFEQERFELQAREAAKELESIAPTVSEVETTEAAEVSSEPERIFSELEREQMERGWDPNHPDGVSAKEFKRVGEIIEAKRKASKEAFNKSKEVEELTMTVKQLVEHNKAIAKASYEQAKKDLALQKLEKIREGDVEAVLELEQQQRALESAPPVAEEAPKAAPAIAPVSEDVRAFQEKYKDSLNGTSPEDKRVQALIKSQVEYYMANDPNINEKTAIAEIEDLLTKAFPDKFEAKVKPKSPKVGTSTVSTSTSSNELASNMSQEDRMLFESIKSVDSTFTIDQFTKMYLKTKK